MFETCSYVLVISERQIWDNVVPKLYIHPVLTERLFQHILQRQTSLQKLRHEGKLGTDQANLGLVLDVNTQVPKDWLNKLRHSGILVFCVPNFKWVPPHERWGSAQSFEYARQANNLN